MSARMSAQESSAEAATTPWEAYGVPKRANTTSRPRRGTEGDRPGLKAVRPHTYPVRTNALRLEARTGPSHGFKDTTHGHYCEKRSR